VTEAACVTRTFTWLTFVMEVEDRVGGFEAVGYVSFVFFVFEGEGPYEALLRWRGVQGFDVE